jgi:hypothetical protein
MSLHPVDACPSCDPGIPDVSLPVGNPEPAGDGLLASYECGTCWAVWHTWFDRYGWPVDRLLAVAPEVERWAA